MFSFFKQQQSFELPEPRQLCFKALYLLKTGHPIPAGMTARVALESLIGEIYREREPNGEFTGLRFRANHLAVIGVFTGRTWRSLKAMINTGHKAAHGQEVNYCDIRGLIRAVQALDRTYRKGKLTDRRKAIAFRRHANLLMGLADTLSPQPNLEEPAEEPAATVL